MVCTDGHTQVGTSWQNSVRMLMSEPNAHPGQVMAWPLMNHKLWLLSFLLSLVHFLLSPFLSYHTFLCSPLSALSFWLPLALHPLSSPLFSSWCWKLHYQASGLALALRYILYTQCVFNFWNKIDHTWVTFNMNAFLANNAKQSVSMNFLISLTFSLNPKV